MGVKLESSGFEYLVKKLKSLQNLDSILEPVIKENTSRFFKLAAKFTPTDAGPIKESMGMSIRPKEGLVYYDIHYAANIEYGYRTGKGYISGQYFLRRAHEAIGPEFLNELCETIQKEMSR